MARMTQEEKERLEWFRAIISSESHGNHTRARENLVKMLGPEKFEALLRTMLCKLTMNEVTQFCTEYQRAENKYLTVR